MATNKTERFKVDIGSTVLLKRFLPIIILVACSSFTLFAQTTDMPDRGYPETQPDMALGAAIFANNCTRCHGMMGAGDGELVLSGEVSNPGNFTDPAQITGRRPSDYFDIITNGNLETLMPPWVESLAEDERWAVALYTYTLSYSEPHLASGKAIYETECARCHGELGLGDGPDVATESIRDIGSLADTSEMVFLSDDNMTTIIAEGAGTAMPAYTDVLTAEEIAAVVAYTRTLSLQEPEPRIISTDGQVTGIVTNGTADAGIPGDLVIELHMIDATLNQTTFTTTIDADNRFTFTDVPVDDTAAYFLLTRYQDRNYAGQPFPLTEAQRTIEQSVIIFEQTSDPTAIEINSVIMQIIPVGDVLEINQEMIFSNNSDRLFVSDISVGMDRLASLEIPLPVGAIIVPTSAQERYAYDEESFTLYDTRALLPGENHQVAFSYLVPYSGNAIIEFPVRYPADSPFILLVNHDNMTVTGEDIVLVDPEVAPNIEAITYGGNLNLNSGESIQFELLGAGPTVTTSEDPTTVTSDTLLPLIIGVIIAPIVVIGGLTMFNLLRRDDDENDKAIDDLMRQMAQLDSQHDTGKINHDLYHAKRRELKAQLKELMNEV